MRPTVPTAWPSGAPSVGDRARRSRRVAERDIALFTEISGDRNPIHYDPSALLNALVAEDLPGPGTVFLQLDLRFLAAVRPGEEITAEAEVVAVRTDKPITELTVSVTTGAGARALEGRAVCYTVPLPTG